MNGNAGNASGDATLGAGSAFNTALDGRIAPNEASTMVGLRLPLPSSWTMRASNCMAFLPSRKIQVLMVNGVSNNTGPAKVQDIDNKARSAGTLRRIAAIIMPAISPPKLARPCPQSVGNVYSVLAVPW